MKGYHMKQHRYFVLLFLSIFVLVSGCAYFSALKKPAAEPATNIQLASIFSDNMVLQQKENCPVWGTADPAGKVTVQLNNQKKETIVGVNGDWIVELSPIKTGGPFELVILGKDTLTFKNVMVGEVWICSGQSNMQWTVKNSDNPEQEIENANYPNIRLFTVGRNVSPDPLDKIFTDGWQECNPTTIPDFSAVGYFFGRDLYKSLNVPIGLIHTSWGGTPAESWTSQSTLKTLLDYLEKVKFIEANMDSLKGVYSNFLQDKSGWEISQQKWKNKLHQMEEKSRSDQPVLYKSDLDISGWDKMQVPKLWEQQGLENFNGFIWFRRNVEIPEDWDGTDLTLNMGAIDDDEITWFNGVEIGRTNGYSKNRSYQVPASEIKKGENVITVKVLDTGGDGGFWGEDSLYHLDVSDNKSIDLSGEWYYKESLNLSDIPKSLRSPSRPSHTPSFLYNAMIYPLIPYSFQGAIWYQGESNAGRAYQYRSLFSSMITDWRENWNQGDFPFLFVQLANYMKVKSEPVDDNWAELREAQTMALSLPNTGMAVTIDIGEADDIHPRNKQDVGKRLALNARKIVYGEKVTYSGPIYKSMEINNNKIILNFDYVVDGLRTKGEKKLNGFAIAGVDGKFYWADAEIRGDQVVVSSPKVENPIAVRYAWSSNPVCNLYNSVGLPASPFRTDDWQGITFGKK
jgi:sialate O-acetylesterase